MKSADRGTNTNLMIKKNLYNERRIQMYKILVKNGKVDGATLWRFYSEEYESLEKAVTSLIEMSMNSSNKVSDFRVVEIVKFEGGFNVQWEDMKRS